MQRWGLPHPNYERACFAKAMKTKVNSVPVLLRNIETHDEPYRFFCSSQCFTTELSDALLAWFDDGIEWFLHEGSFYEQWECDLLRQLPPESCESLFLPKTLGFLRRSMEARFHVELGEKMTVVAHKLVRGQAIAVHNDDPDPGEETHRLIVQINHGFKPGLGALRVHKSRNPEDVFLTLNPKHNSAFGFAMSHNSYHSVTQMGDWTRYSIIFSFWTKTAEAMVGLPKDGRSQPREAQRTASQIAETLSPGELERVNQLVVFLEGLGANAKNHSAGTLLEHLLHTYLILRSWGCSVDLATAGLFHSIYGTPHFAESTLSLEDRQTLAQIIGTKAENLAYLYCTCSMDSIFENLGRSEPCEIFNTRVQGHMPLDRETVHELVILDLANAIEQMPRVSQDAEDLRKERQRYELALPFLPPAAMAMMRSAYSVAV